MDEAENEINDLKHNKAKNKRAEHQEEKRIQENEDSVRILCNNFKCSNFCMIGVPEREEKEQENENLIEKT